MRYDTDGPAGRSIGPLSRRTCLIGLVILYLAIAAFIALTPYDPMEDDIADATTNAIWTEQYSKGVYEIPYENWTYGGTQSVVVDHDGRTVVVNEKGPGLVVMLVPFHVLGIEVLFGPLMVAIALFSTYMLGSRLSGKWQVGIASSLIVLLNVSVIVMWYRYYWTDAATMHLLVLSVWLLVESIYRSNGRYMRKERIPVPMKDTIAGYSMAVGSGIAFGASVSTRYPVGLVLIALVLYVLVYYAVKAWPWMRKGEWGRAGASMRGVLLLAAFGIGLAVVMLPLMEYNSEYFGGPFRSGYDAQSLITYGQTNSTEARDQSVSWIENIGGGIENAARNVFAVGPTLLFRMPALLLAPIGLWALRKDRPALTLFITWIAIGLFTYLSLSWITRYVGWDFIMNRAHEPRYFMPVIPASAVLGGIAIDRLAFGKGDASGKTMMRRPRNAASNREVNGMIIAGALILLIAIPGIYPAWVHFSDPSSVFPKGMGGGGQRDPPDGGSQPPPFITTDILLERAEEIEGKQVRIKDAVITDVASEDIFMIRSVGSKDGAVGLRLADWPEAQRPDLSAGDHIELSGTFKGFPSSDSYVITVKWGTRDYLKEL